MAYYRQKANLLRSVQQSHHSTRPTRPNSTKLSTVSAMNSSFRTR
jgi:hypothetical protein